jgi:hypothetical protein
MTGFPRTSLITAVVPAAAVLAGAALTGRQNNQAGRTAALKADYAAFVQAVTALIERLDGIAHRDDASEPAGTRQVLSAVALARGVVDLAGSYGARRTASDVWGAAREAITEHEAGRRTSVISSVWALRATLEDFLRVVRSEVGGGSRPRAQVDHSKRPATQVAGAARPAS